MNKEVILSEEELRNEEWKQIPEFPDYMISNLGRVKVKGRYDSRQHFHRQHFMHGSDNGHGYLSVMLTNIGEKSKRRYIHILVAEAFVSKTDAQNVEVNHNDENTFNNRASNLSWMTHKDNVNYGTILERKSKSQLGKPRPDKGRPVYQIDIETEKVLAEYLSCNEAARAIVPNSQNKTNDFCAGIRHTCEGISESSLGYYWCYKDEYDPVDVASILVNYRNNKGKHAQNRSYVMIESWDVEDPY